MFELLDDEKELLFSLTGHAKVYPPQYDDALNYFLSIGLASKHYSGWAKGHKTDEAIRFYKQRPSRIKTCSGCNQ